jgi:hypothetical protein
LGVPLVFIYVGYYEPSPILLWPLINAGFAVFSVLKLLYLDALGRGSPSGEDVLCFSISLLIGAGIQIGAAIALCMYFYGRITIIPFW